MNPDTYTLQETFVEVGDGHTLYVHEWGSQNGMPIMYLHGGPGNGCNDRYKQLFDPKRHRVIFFDQRGSGRSLPTGTLKNNTTADLVEDIEKLARHFKLTSFTLTGGSWGSCLALAYGIAYPKRVKSMVLSGIFTGSHAEINYYGGTEYALLFPEVREALLASTPKSHHNNLLKYHYERALGDDQQAAKESAYALSTQEISLLSLDDRLMLPSFEEFDPTSALIEIHYMANYCFLPDRSVFSQASKLTMPIWLIQGRYDMVCPPRTAYELHKVLPDSELIWAVSGHRGEREVWNIERSLLMQLAREHRQ